MPWEKKQTRFQSFLCERCKKTEKLKSTHKKRSKIELEGRKTTRETIKQQL